MKKSLALDLHGIINAHPAFFASITQSLVKDGWEIHVLTGSHLEEDKIANELKGYGIAYTHLFSIADYHKQNNTPGMWYDKKGDPWVSDLDWDRTKAEYCKTHEIAFCIDDTARYAHHFETPFGYMTIQSHREKPNKYLNLIIDMFEKRRNPNAFKKVENWFDKNFGWFFNPSRKQGKEKRNEKYK